MQVTGSQPLFFLQCAASSYVIGVHPQGTLCHLYWGPKVSADACADFAKLLDIPVRPFSTDIRNSDGARTPLDILPSEYPTANTGDFAPPAIDVEHADGSRGLRLAYESHRIIPGKPPIPGLPSTYAETDDEAATLEILLRDAPSNILVTLRYAVFANRDAIARSAEVKNEGAQPVTLRRALSAAIDFPERPLDMIHLPGAWARERWVERQPLHSGEQWIASRRGASSHQHNPFFALASPETTEEQGEVFGFSFVYSGNHIGGVDVDQYRRPRALAGIHPDGFAWRLETGETFHTPEVVLAHSSQGLGALSRTYHRLYRERLVRGPWRDRERPVLINNWEATYFDFTEDKLAGIASIAAEIGCELFVLDDGWFGRRGAPDSALGDWFVNKDKLPDGLSALVKRINDQGLAFGLWFEPEMVSEKSRLHEQHPDWCLHLPNRPRTQSRFQLVLDFSRAEVVDAIFAQMEAVIASAPIRYIKWDMNRHLTEIGSAALPPGRQGETAHRHILGVYSLLERILARFPEILIEGCSGGGGRFDPGMLHYTPQIWTSDNSDAIARLRIQHGTSLVYPLCTMGAHISAVPNHQVHRATSMRTRGHVALAGIFGFELDLGALNQADRDEAATLTRLAKKLRHLIRHGDHYRLADPFATEDAAWMIALPDASEAIVTHVTTLIHANWHAPRLRLRALDPDATYRNEINSAEQWRGDFLMRVGLPLTHRHDFTSTLWHLKRV
ncbi:alpha-galactosidase [Ereboglobus luteus]|uniref:Alpha-galactosidase n=1 Tax=Ereboglobus luteus TaxID=1796921 RepID=A0A2U8E3D4_9BACT|nr:alpha-galactosidase [Ereboglobus luteus]